MTYGLRDLLGLLPAGVTFGAFVGVSPVCNPSVPDPGAWYSRWWAVQGRLTSFTPSWFVIVLSSLYYANYSSSFVLSMASGTVPSTPYVSLFDPGVPSRTTWADQALTEHFSACNAFRAVRMQFLLAQRHFRWTQQVFFRPSGLDTVVSMDGRGPVPAGSYPRTPELASSLAVTSARSGLEAGL